VILGTFEATILDVKQQHFGSMKYIFSSQFDSQNFNTVHHSKIKNNIPVMGQNFKVTCGKFGTEKSTIIILNNNNNQQ
jgi:hypothetical protein